MGDSNKTLRLALCVGFALMGCGSGSGSPDGGITFTDGDNGGADSMIACNPVANTGCLLGQKCTFIVEGTEPFVGRTGCADAGDKTLGEDCTRNAVGVDDCQASLWCLAGVCNEVCTGAPDSCPMSPDPGFTCVTFVDVFEDLDGVGLCQSLCTPVAAGGTGCADGQGCYLNLTSGKSSCANPFTSYDEAATGSPNCASSPGGQGCNCRFLNGCQPGYGCILNNMPGTTATGLTCSFFCDVNAAGGPACADGPGPAADCRVVQTFYSNTESVPEETGMCVDPTVWLCAGCIDETHPGCDAQTCT